MPPYITPTYIEIRYTWIVFHTHFVCVSSKHLQNWDRIILYFWSKCHVSTKRYNQVPHLTQNTTWERHKNAINNTNKSQEASSFPADDHNAVMNRRKSTRNTRHKTQITHKRSTALERSVKYFT